MYVIKLPICYNTCLFTICHNSDSLSVVYQSYFMQEGYKSHVFSIANAVITAHVCK